VCKPVFSSFARDQQRHVVSSVLRPEESPEEALERRLRESQRVEERVNYVDSPQEFEEALRKAGNKLVVFEVQGENVCELGLDEEPEVHWNRDKKKMDQERLAKCSDVKHAIQRTARECPDVVFLSHQVGDDPSDDSTKLCDKVGVDILPTLQFWLNGRKLWEHRGVLHMDNNLGEGMLFYGNSAANGVKASDHVKEIRTRQDFRDFVTAEEDDTLLKVVTVTLQSAAPCLHIFPAVLALARNFTGFAEFSRLQGDTTPELRTLMRQYNIVEVPTFLFFRGGREIGRHVGSSRGDLIGQILRIQSEMGLSPPPVPGTGTPRRRKVVRRV